MRKQIFTITYSIEQLNDFFMDWAEKSGLLAPFADTVGLFTHKVTISPDWDVTFEVSDDSDTIKD